MTRRLLYLTICLLCMVVSVVTHAGEEDSEEHSSSKSSTVSTNKTTTKTTTTTTTTRPATATTTTKTISRKASSQTSSAISHGSTSSPQASSQTSSAISHGSTSSPQVTKVITVLVNATASPVKQNNPSANERALVITIGVLVGVTVVAIFSAILVCRKSVASSRDAAVKSQASVETSNPVYRVCGSGRQTPSHSPPILPRINIPGTTPSGDYLEPVTDNPSPRSSGSTNNARPLGSRRNLERTYLELLPD